jgi:hypothetical protein
MGEFGCTHLKENHMTTKASSDAANLGMSFAAAHDSRVETLEHIRDFQRLMISAVCLLMRRIPEHDASKLVDPEKSVYDAHPGRVPYGTKEYGARLLKMRVALEHHYKNNRHHPEHFADGIEGMSLIDVFEMLLDWYAAACRFGGNIRESIEINTRRFLLTAQLKAILLNTIQEIEKEI